MDLDRSISGRTGTSNSDLLSANAHYSVESAELRLVLSQLPSFQASSERARLVHALSSAQMIQVIWYATNRWPGQSRVRTDPLHSGMSHDPDSTRLSAVVCGFECLNDLVKCEMVSDDGVGMELARSH